LEVHGWPAEIDINEAVHMKRCTFLMQMKKLTTLVLHRYRSSDGVPIDLDTSSIWQSVITQGARLRKVDVNVERIFLKYHREELSPKMQARREGVKGVTVSRGPGRKRGPENYENKRKIGLSKEIPLFWAPNLQASRATKL
jgi:hypothetical protein